MSVMSQLSTLEAGGLIRLSRVEPDLEYLFRHALVQEAAYASLLPDDRKQLHLAVGKAVERLYTDRLASRELAATLALHFERAGEARRALGYYTQAARAALAAYANREAEEQFRAALNLSPTLGERAGLLSGLGEALVGQNRFAEAIQIWREGMGLYQELGDRDGVARLYARSARTAWIADDTPGGLQLAEEGLQVVAGVPESVESARLMHEAARAYHFNGLPEQAHQLCRQALAMAERLGSVEVQADALATLGVLPDLPAEEKLAALVRAVDLAESAGLMEVAQRAHHNLGVMQLDLLGGFDTGLRHFLRAAELARQRGVIPGQVFSLVSALGIMLGRGEIAAVEAKLREFEELECCAPKPEPAYLELMVIRAVLAWMKGERAAALRIHRVLQAEARQRGNLQVTLSSSREMVSMLIDLDRLGELEDWHEAEALCTEALQLADRGLASKVGPRCTLSIVRARQGNMPEAKRFLDEARVQAGLRPTMWTDLELQMAEVELAIAEFRWSEALDRIRSLVAFMAKTGRRWSVAWWLMFWARAHAGRGELMDLERARALLREAQSLFAEMGATSYVEMAEKLQEDLRTRAHEQLLDLRKAAQELAIAGRIQAGLLPAELPYLPGWQLAAVLNPARETSGDFYDFVPLPDNRWGIVIADVADKGAGAALYMALSRTLVRASLAQFGPEPDVALREANQRLLADYKAEMFVTLFLGILEPGRATLTYCNAGHLPPIHLAKDGTHTLLSRTGLPLGIMQEMSWEPKTLTLRGGDALILYTDGVTEARSAGGEMFGRDRLIRAAQMHLGRPAHEIQTALLTEMHEFMGKSAQVDDVALVILTRS